MPRRVRKQNPEQRNVPERGILVEDEKEKMFDEVVDNLEQQYGKSVNLKYTVQRHMIRCPEIK